MNGAELELLALDVGERRIGVARGQLLVGIPEPLDVIDIEKTNPYEKISNFIKEYQPDKLVVGMPESLHKKTETNLQSEQIKSFVEELKKHTNKPVIYVDESLSTVLAEQWRVRYPEAGEDSLAACVILERCMQELTNGKL